MNMTSAVFYIIAVILVASTIGVMRMRDVFRAGLFLILSFFCVAGIYITLNADLLAGVQVLVYVGAIGILLMFAIMLTRNIETGNPAGRLNMPALLVSVVVFGLMMYVVVAQDWDASGFKAEFDEKDHTPSIVREIDGDEKEIVDIGVVMPIEVPSVNEDGNITYDENGEIILESNSGSTSYVAEALFDKENGFVLPFEIASVLLLAALIGAIVLVRSKDEE